VCHYLAYFVGPVVLLSLVAGAICYVRMLHGPVSLKTFKEDIESSINANLGDFTVKIDDAVLALGDDRRIELRLVNLRLSEHDGDLVASAPEAAVELSTAALWQLEAAPERIYLIEPRLAVLYSERQGFSLSIAEAPPAANDDASGAAPVVPPAPVPAVRPQPQSTEAAPAFHRVDLARVLAEMSARARSGGAATSQLRELGVRNATVTFDYGGRTTDLVVSEAAVDLEHLKKRSIISGTATVETDKGPWSLAFRTENSDRRDLVKLTTAVRDLVPSTLSKLTPQLNLLEMLDTPVTGELALEMTSGGDLKTASLTADIARGFVRLPSLAATPVLLDSGRLVAGYDADTRRLRIEPTTLVWGNSRISVEGAISSDPSQPGEPQWHFGIKSIDGVLATEEFGVAPIPIESFVAAGRIIPGEGLAQLSELSLKAGGAEVAITGEIISGGPKPGSRIEASLSPMPLATLKALWPRAIAATARNWVGAQVSQASVRGASLKLLSGRFLATEGSKEGAAPAGERLSASMDVSDVLLNPLPNSLPVEAPQALIRIENSSLEVKIPDAAIVSSPGQKLPLKDARFTVVDMTHDAPIAEFALSSQSSLSALIDVLNHSQLHLAGQGPLPIEGVEGKLDGQVKISMPLVPGGGMIKAEGKARVTDLKGKSKAHNIDLQGGAIDISVSDIGVIAQGEMILNGVLAKLNMHRILDAPPDMQPPLRISANLDNSDRTQLGLDVNHLVQGDVAVEVTIAQKADAEAAVHLRADLTNAELLFDDLAWSKSPGRPATLEFDIAARDPKTVDLTNFRLVGDNVAIDGSLVLDDKHDVREFDFPNFSLNVVSRLEVHGKISPDRIWNISAKGSTFDAKDLFRSLVALGKTSDQDLKALRPAAGVDLSAEVDTVLGHSDVSLRNYKVKLAERAEQLVSIDAQGELEGGKQIAVRMRPEQGSPSRKVYAEATDAGQALKLVGFYPNMQGGHLKLEVNLDAQGPAERSGTLWVENFRVLGDPIISEVYSSGENTSPTSSEDRGAKKQKRVEQREVFEFERMKVPFSVGHGQFVLDESYIRGPLLGASIRGKVDYNTHRLNLGGTYVPLQGINSALCEIPLFGPIVTGLDCQGVFGITYAIQGPMQAPQAIVNPLSMFTPGILRGIMEMTSPNPQVLAPQEQSKGSAEQRVRASSSSIAGEEGTQLQTGPVDGWSSQTTPSGTPKSSTTPKAQ
jgi:hypothetical protein